MYFLSPLVSGFIDAIQYVRTENADYVSSVLVLKHVFMIAHSDFLVASASFSLFAPTMINFLLEKMIVVHFPFCLSTPPGKKDGRKDSWM